MMSSAQLSFSTQLIRCYTALAIGCIILFTSACSTVPDTGETAKVVSARDLLTVDCLLPPQVRQLGTHATYIGPRRPVRTSGDQCAMRGGEYVAYDRADFKSALAAWLPLAEDGDPQAQTYVGEIHEKGMGTRASYELAADWYTRAAQQNYSRAQINLGYLYESGLGVKRDLVRALNLYRMASGFTAAELEFVSSIEIARREAEIHNTERLQSDVLMLQANITKGHHELELKTAQLQKSQQEITQLRNALQQLQSADKRMTAESASAAVPNQSAQSAQHLQQELSAREDELAQQTQLLTQLRDELTQWQARLPPDAIERTTETASKGPVINIIDPPIFSTRSSPTVALNGYGLLDLIGKIEPANDLYIFRINGEELPVTKTGMFRYSAPPDQSPTLELLAVDNQGESTRLAISIAQSAKATKAIDTSAKHENSRLALNPAEFGEYHALIIGNDTYDSMNNLRTAGNDAIAVESILQKKYGFETTLLLNANQQTLLGALERLRVTLGNNDNLVIYYAGHGELDRQSGRGYWLPTDANAENKDKWIANSAITAMIDLMPAKHILIVADSCYSGTLTRSSVARPLPETSAALRLKWLKAVSQVRVRAVLSSGSIKPVLDGSPSSEHSVFAENFINALQQNNEVIEAYELFFQLQSAVTRTAARQNVQQTPQYAPIRHAGHQAGEFIFLPAAQSSVSANHHRTTIRR